MEIDLTETQSKIAIGCSYKYMNGGPGSPAFLFIERKFQNQLSNPIQGWFGHKNPFAFEPNYKPNSSINKFASGTIPILSMQAMEAGVDLTLAAGIKNIRKKSVQLSGFFLNGTEEKLIKFGFKLESPINKDIRGSHLAISHKASWQICQDLIKGKSNSPQIIPDFRPPNLIRFGISPLYTSFEDLYVVIRRLEDIILSKSFQKFDKSKPNVT